MVSNETREATMRGETQWRRRTLLGAGPAAVLLASGAARADTVPWSAGSEQPVLIAPPNATDCHHHIYDSRFKVAPTATLRPGDATVADYRKLQARIRTSRNIVVQPSTYGTDNALLVEALGQFGAQARGVAVVDTSVTDAELDRLHKAGVRGIRFNLVQAGATTPAMVEPLAARVNERGWHVQFHLLAAQIAEMAPLFARVPAQMVFDHMGRLPEPEGIRHPAFKVIAELVQKNRAWVKLSGAYMDTKLGPPAYADTSAVAKAYLDLAPERMVWGSDWPHPTEKVKPDDAILFDLLLGWAPNEATRQRLLVENPAKLYGFPA